MLNVGNHWSSEPDIKQNLLAYETVVTGCARAL